MTDLRTLPCSICTLLWPAMRQPQGLREQIPYMLVAGGRTKEVSRREISIVKKKLENIPPPTWLVIGRARGKKRRGNSSSFTPDAHLGLAFENEADIQ